MAARGAAATGGSGASAPAAERAQNVKVAVRVRPFNKREKGLGAASIIDVGSDKKSITMTNPKADKASDAPKTSGKLLPLIIPSVAATLNWSSIRM